jgi:hypothetical protein
MPLLKSVYTYGYSIGAAIAVFALFTNNLTVFLNGQSKVADIGFYIFAALVCWEMGTLCASVSYGLSYLSQGYEQEYLNQYSSVMIDRF